MAATAPLFVCNDRTDREAWVEARRSGIGGSDAPAILGISPFSSPAKVAAQKRGLLAEESKGELVENAHYFEPAMVQMFLDDMERAGAKGWSAEISGNMWRCQKPGQEMMMTTLDGQVVDPDGRAGIVECKFKRYQLEEWDDGVPDYVVAQAQHAMEVVDAPFGVVIGLLDYKPRWKVIERSDSFLAERLVPAEVDFWRRLEADEPFAFDLGTGEVNLAVLRQLHPDDNGELVKLEGEKMLEAARQWKHQAGLRLAAEKLEKAAKAVLAGAIGDASYGVLDDGTQLSLKTQSKSAGHHEASKSRVLRQDSAKTARAVRRELAAK